MAKGYLLLWLLCGRSGGKVEVQLRDAFLAKRQRIIILQRRSVETHYSPLTLHLLGSNSEVYKWMGYRLGLLLFGIFL